MSEETKFSQAELDAAVEKAVGPLKSKLDEVMDEAKEAKRKLRAASEIKPEDVAALESDNDKLRADLTAAQKAAKEATTASEKAGKALETEQGFTRRLLAENGLREALAANGVTNAVHQKAAMAMLAPGVQIHAEGETRVAKVGDKSLGDAVKEWASGDEGKHFVSAPHNGGGGAGGGGGQGGGKAWKDMNLTEQSTLARADPALAQSMAKAGGVELQL